LRLAHAITEKRTGEVRASPFGIVGRELSMFWKRCPRRATLQTLDIFSRGRFVHDPWHG